MATVQTTTELQRFTHLLQIVNAVQARFPDTCQQRIQLNDIAKLCKTIVASRPCRDCHTVRDEILTLACLWNLGNDGLDEQSDELLAHLAGLVTNMNSRGSG